MHAVILAAGQALRLQGFNGERPKGLLEIDGRSLLDYSLDNLVSRGVTSITIVTGHRDGMIQRSLGSQYRGATAPIPTIRPQAAPPSRLATP